MLGKPCLYGSKYLNFNCLVLLPSYHITLIVLGLLDKFRIR